ncbi:MAG TPA: acetyl-CoA C-acyltransferase FadA [Planctomycetales bacterium]|jgi:acetyl-CoA acyltransferase|nr:acetyl-CoA C-acyltransferase FadA [Planctomycetales bacterium]
MRHAVVIDAVRTPIGRAHPDKGIFRDVRADDLSADLMRALVDRVGIPGSAIEDVVWGCVKQQGEQGYDIAHMASLIAGLPLEVAGVTVNRNCGSSLQAINQAAQSIAANCEDIQIAGGVEHMQHIPMEAGFDASPRLFYRHSPATMQMGLTAENLAMRYRIGRREQDEFALRSHQRAAKATDTGLFSKEIIPTWGRDEEGRRKIMHEDQCIRRDTSLEALGALKPAFMPEGGTVTAGNSSPLNVGAAALLIMSEERAKELGLKPMVRIRAMAVAGVDPSVMGIGPVPATLKALERAGLKLEDIDLIELNEAFAAQALSVIKVLKANPERVNVRGGAIAIGHPLGGSGARIATTLIHTMMDQKARFGLATMCIGAGQGIATIFEAV